MNDEWANNTMKSWEAQGMLTRAHVVERLNLQIRNSYAIQEEEWAVLKQIFESEGTDRGDGIAILTESAFISLLQTKAALPRSPEGIQAGKIIHASIAYLSTLPFPQRPEAVMLQSPGLSLNQLGSALAWVFTDRSKYIFEEGNDYCSRTRTDHRRLIFQSLASTTHDKAYDRERVPKSFNELDSSKYDDDGDEIYHDVLDVIYSTQEVKHPGLSTVPLDAFRPVAKRLVAENEVPLLHSLGIPIERFADLVKLLLAFQFAPTEASTALSQFNEAAKSLCGAFCLDAEAEVITWPMFDHGLRDIAPYLFDSLYRLLSHTFLDKPNTIDVLEVSEAPRMTGSILTLPLQSQLATFLSGSVYFGWFRRMHHYVGQDRPTSIELIHQMQSVPDEAVMIISGTTATGQCYTFGLFSPKPKVDGSSIQTNIIPDHVGQERCAIFQLTPVQDVFRGGISKPGWVVDNESVTFGQGGGAVLVLKDGLRRAVVRHQVTVGGENTGVYAASGRRGSWTVELEISEIEIWGSQE